MRPTEIAKRLRGFSTPFGGVSWDAPEAEAAVARRVIRFLEDRRVLYNPSEGEYPQECVDSVLQIRRFLTSELGNLSGEDLALQLAAIRVACRKFLDTVRHLENSRHHGYEEWVFFSALGELRGIVGVLVAEVAARYHVEVEGDLASILPNDPDAELDSVIDAAQSWPELP